MNYEAVIGLEIHSELKTNTKIFCGCATKFGAEQNTHVCPVCLGLPGVLYVHIHTHDGETTVDYDPAKTKMTELISTFAAHGLSAEL